MLQIKDLHYSIGERQLLAGVDWNLQPGKRVALVGPNGIGKTTLLRIIMGQLEYSGDIIKPKDYHIGWLPQEEITVQGTTALQTVLEGQKELTKLELQITELHHQLDRSGTGTADETGREELLHRLGQLEHRYQAMEGYHIETKAKRILSGLGFKENDFSRPLTEFSGGWRMRVYLALLLVQNPDLLLLDEPTNHLDLPSLEWLEQYLLNFNGSIVIVSHDRFFIDRVAQEIVELDRGKLEHYPGNYHAYEQKKEQKQALLLKKWKEQKEERERQERFINRFRYKNTKAKQVQSRIKMLEKMGDQEIEPPVQISQKLDFTLSLETISYNDVLTLEQMSFRYRQDWVLQEANLNIYRGDKVCLVGPNGAGKTTLTRLIVGQLQPVSGILKLGERTVIGYYAQHQVDTLNLENSVYDEVASTVATSLVPKIRDILGLFQFSGSDIYKKINVLSGGEKARVSLAKILISPVNFLIMDEPTNHLDKTAREALEKALSQYNGTLLLISHDRYFLDKIVNRVVEVRQGKLIAYDGNYSYYLDKRDNSSVPAAENKSSEKSFPTPPRESQNDSTPGSKKTKEQKRLEAEARQAVSKERNRLQTEVTGLEEKIEALEKKKDQLESQLAAPETYNQSELTIRLQKEYARVNKELTHTTQLWEDASLQLEEILRSIT